MKKDNSEGESKVKKKDKTVLDLNKVDLLTQEELDDYEPGRLRLEAEIRQEEEKVNTKVMNAIIFSFEDEKKKRCEKE